MAGPPPRRSRRDRWRCFGLGTARRAERHAAKFRGPGPHADYRRPSCGRANRHSYLNSSPDSNAYFNAHRHPDAYSDTRTNPDSGATYAYSRPKGWHGALSGRLVEWGKWLGARRWLEGAEQYAHQRRL